MQGGLRIERRPGVLQRMQGEALPLAVSTAVFLLSMKWVAGVLDPNKDAKRAGKRRGDALSKRLGRRIQLQDLEQVAFSNSP